MSRLGIATDAPACISLGRAYFSRMSASAVPADSLGAGQLTRKGQEVTAHRRIRSSDADHHYLPFAIG